jgi:hypothetical protein
VSVLESEILSHCEQNVVRKIVLSLVLNPVVQDSRAIRRIVRVKLLVNDEWRVIR